MRALETALDFITDEFGGEDVLKPITWEALDKTHQKALSIHELIQDWTGPFELPDAAAEDVKQTRELIDKWADNCR